MAEVTLDKEHELYVIPSHNAKGKVIGYSHHGFKVVERLAKHLARELGEPAPKAAAGTLEMYREYQELLKKGQKRHAETGWRSTAELTPELIGLEGERVEVITEWGSKERFIVGKSTGWMPIHLEIKKRNSMGGGGVAIGKPRSVKVLPRLSR